MAVAAEVLFILQEGVVVEAGVQVALIYRGKWESPVRQGLQILVVVVEEVG